MREGDERRRKGGREGGREGVGEREGSERMLKPSHQPPSHCTAAAQFFGAPDDKTTKLLILHLNVSEALGDWQ